MFDFNGKSVLITGGSRGLGRALALRLSAEGAKVAMVARRREELDEVVREIRERGGIAFGIVADVGDKESIYPIVGQATALAGPVDVLINNASALGPVPFSLFPTPIARTSSWRCRSTPLARSDSSRPSSVQWLCDTPG